MSQAQQTYIPRIVDQQISDLVASYPAIVIDGPKAVGKTSSASQVANTVLRVDVPRIKESLENNPDQLASADKPVLIDEWQHYPPIWDAVRRFVDDSAQPGSYILAGSAYPATAKIHSGAGRIIHLRMRPLSLQERQLATPVVSLKECLQGTIAKANGMTQLTAVDYIHELVRSGFPAIWLAKEENRGMLLDSYIDNIVNKEFPELGQSIRRPDSLLRWLRAYATASGTSASYTSILDIATPGESNKLSRSTMETYRNALTGLWLMDEVPAWNPLEGGFSRLKQSPKHFLADPAITARLLGFDEKMLLEGAEDTRFDNSYGTLVGRLFESLIALSLQTYATANNAKLGYMRSRNGDREVDFIVHQGRKIVAIEVKFSPTVTDSDVRHLKWLRDEYGKHFMEGIIITTGESAYRRHDEILVVPAALLGA